MHINKFYMTEGNVTPPKTPVYDDSEIEVVAGRGMEEVQEPAEAETTDTVEDTTIKTQTEAPVNQTEGDVKRSSKQIAELGEDRKRLASELIDLARESDIAAEKVKELMEEDPRMEKLIKTKFGDDYDRLIEGKPLERREKVDIERVKEQARVEARTEIILKEAEATKQKQFEIFAQSSGLNTSEAELVKENTELLESKYGYEKAMEMSLLLVNKDKALASTTQNLPSGTESSASPSKEPQVTPELKAYTKRYMPGRTPQDVAEGLKRVDGRLSQEGDRQIFRLSED